jgi:hypothetical protein
VVEVKPEPPFEKNYHQFKEESLKREIFWDIEELEYYFTEANLPTGPVQLNSWTRIDNISLFLESSLATVKANIGEKTFKPYFDLLVELKNIYWCPVNLLFSKKINSMTWKSQSLN